MKVLKRIACTVLALCLMVGFLSVSAFASGKSPYTVTVVGDSVGAGFGLDEYHKDINWNQLRDEWIVDGNFASRLQSFLNDYFTRNKIDAAAELRMDAHSGWRTTECIRALFGYADGSEFDAEELYLGTPFTIDDFTCPLCSSDFYWTGFSFARNSFTPEGDPILPNAGVRMIEDIEAADLITLNFGSNDIFTYGVSAAASKWTPVLSELIDGFSDPFSPNNLSDLIKALVQVLQNSDEGECYTFLSDFVNAMEIGLARYQKNLPVILDKVHELNAAAGKSAEIEVISLQHPVIKPISIGDAYIDLGAYMDPLIVRANAAAMAECVKRDYCRYVDVSGTEYFRLDLSLFSEITNTNDSSEFLSQISDLIKVVHPNENGHEHMAERIFRSVIAGFSAPTDVSAKKGVLAKPQITWTAVEGAKGYAVYRSLTGIAYHPVKIVKGTSATDLTALPGVTYYYKVTSLINADGTLQSAMSSATKPIKTSSLLSCLKWAFCNR